MLTKTISGGHTGADGAALEVAIAFGTAHGGGIQQAVLLKMAPWFFVTKRSPGDRPLPFRWSLREMHSHA